MAAAARTPGAGSAHVPVLLDEVLAALDPVAGREVVDGTFGGGGYTHAFLAAGAARVVAIDRDNQAIRAAAWAGAQPRLKLIEGRFGALDRIARAAGLRQADAVVLDIGVSSFQLNQAARGFSFLRDGPLDMRMSGSGPSAAEIINSAPEEVLAEIIFRFGEERASRRIARAIVRARADAPVTRTGQLADLVAGCLPRPRQGQVHPATRTFQALRIAVNDELGELVRGLAAAERLLAEGGVLAVVSFHSLEDRIVKRFLQQASAVAGRGSRHAPGRALPPPRFGPPARAVTPGPAELAANPRARSARLRAARRTAAPAIDPDPRRLGLPPAPTADSIAPERRR